MLSPSIEALTIGNWRSASTTALAMNAVNVSFAPAASYSALCFSRSAADPAEVHLVHRVDVRRRVRAEHHVLGDLLAHHAHRHDLRRSRRAGTTGPWRRRACRASCRRGRLLSAPPDSMKPRMSCLVTRPLIPVPWICWMSTSCSLRDPAHERRRLLPPQLFLRQRTCARAGGCRRVGRPRFGSRGAIVRPRVPVDGADVSGCPTAAAGSAPRRRAVRAVCRRRRLLAGGADHRDDAVDRNRLAFLDLDLGQDAGGRRRDLGIHLVGRNLEQRLVAVDRVADLLDPADDRPFGDRLAHLGHHDVGCHSFSGAAEAAPVASASICDQLLGRRDHLVDARQERSFERRRIRHRRVQRCDAHDRRVQVLERLLGDDRRELAADAAGQRRLVQQQHPAGLGDAMSGSRRDRAARGCAGRAPRPATPCSASCFAASSAV